MIDVSRTWTPGSRERKTTMTKQQATELERAMEIAREKHHKVFTAKATATGQTVYTVRSSTDPNHFYILYIAEGRIHCQCQRHLSGHICSHAAAVRLFLIEQREALKAIEAREEQERQEAAPICPTEDEFDAAYQAAFAQALEAEETALAAQEAQEDAAYQAATAQAEQRVNNGFRQRLVERIREGDALMGRHTELGPTLKAFDYVDADPRATALLADTTFHGSIFK